MGQIIQFMSNHWVLWTAFFVVLLIILIYEFMHRKLGAKGLSAQQAVQLMNHSDMVILDIRSEAEYKKAHILGAIHLSLQSVQENLQTIDKYKSKPILLYCSNGMQSRGLGSQLKRKGFENVHVISGGIAAWREAHFPVTRD